MLRGKSTETLSGVSHLEVSRGEDTGVSDEILVRQKDPDVKKQVSNAQITQNGANIKIQVNNVRSLRNGFWSVAEKSLRAEGLPEGTRRSINTHHAIVCVTSSILSQYAAVASPPEPQIKAAPAHTRFLACQLPPQSQLPPSSFCPSPPCFDRSLCLS